MGILKQMLVRIFQNELKAYFMKNLIWRYVLLCLLFTACIHNSSQSDVNIDLDPFVIMAANASCADKANRLYLIDEKLVFWVVEGSCSDASFNYRLFYKNPENVVCYTQDSIAGPQSKCLEKYQQLFATVVANLDESDLGLGVDYEVKQIS